MSFELPFTAMTRNLFSYWNSISLDNKSLLMYSFLDFWVLRWKLIPHTIFETTSSGFIEILHHSSLSWKNSFVFFWAQPCIILTTIVHQRELLGFLSDWVKIHQIPHDILETKYLLILNSDAKSEENPPICCFKNDKNLLNFDPSTQKSQKFALSLVSFVQSI